MARKAKGAAEHKPAGEVVLIGTPGRGLKARGPRRRRALRVVLQGLFSAIALTALLIGAMLLYIMDRPLAAPPWVQARIEAHLAEVAPDTRIRFGGMVLTVQRGWRPMLELRDVRFEDSVGTPLLALSDLQATLAMRPLLDGLVQPRTVAMSGLFATLRRGADGQVSVVTTPEAGGSALSAATLPALIGQVDGLFVIPELAALRSVEVSSITLRFEDARAHKVWTVDGARLDIARNGSDLTVLGDLALLSGGADVATMAANFTSPIGAAEAQFGVTVNEVAAEDIAAFNPAFGWLDILRAPISGSLRGGLNADGSLAPINATLQIAEGVLQPTGDTRPVPFTSARTYFEFDPANATLRFDELSFVSAWGRASADGMASLGGLEQGRLSDLVGQVTISEMQIDPPGTYDTPRTLGRAAVDFRLVPEPFRVDLGRFVLRDPQAGGPLRLKGVLAAAPGGWELALDGRMDRLVPDRLLALWPTRAAPNLRDWMAENLTGGTFRDVDLAVRSVPGSALESYIGFGFEDMEIRYVREMPPITGARGRASILGARFAMALDEGQVMPAQGGAVDAASSTLVIPDMTVKPAAHAEIRLRTSGTATALLALLDSPPLGLLSKAGLSPALMEAEAEADTVLSLPLRPGLTEAEIGFEVAGTLRDVRSDTLVPGRVLTAPALSVTAANRGAGADFVPGITVAGAGLFDTIPFEGEWRQVFGQEGSAVTAQVALSAGTVEALSLGLPPGSVRGQGVGQLDLSLPKGAAPGFSLQSDLAGLTLGIPALGWYKGPDTTGTLEIAGTLGPVPAVDLLSLSAPGLDATGQVSLRADGGGLEAAQFDRVQVGGWLDAPVTLSGRGPGAAPAIAVRGGTLDLRGADFGSNGSSGGASGPLTLALDALQITDTIALTDMRGDFDLRPGLDGRFIGRVNGRAPVTGQVVPQAGRSAFQIESDDAGAVFAAAGFLKQARGGQMRLVLSPVGTAGAFNGALSITETRVTDAPAIAELLNALSVVGLLEQMGGQGLHFQDVEAAFRLTPERVTLTEASAVGPSIGLSMDGTYDMNTAQMDMQGVFSPLYLINGVGSLLTGRGEGLIGFNFNLSGPASDPNVQVNPLSALTPSIFREIFRRPPPEVTAEPGEAPGTAPRLLRPEPQGPSSDGKNLAEDR